MGRPRKNSLVPDWTGMPEAEGARKEIKIAIEQTHPCFAAIENERGNIKDIFDDLHAKYGIPRRVFNSLAKFSYFGNADEAFSKNEEIQNAWEALDTIGSSN